MNIAIITGGLSGEREISINSAKSVAEVIKFSNITTFLYPQQFEEFLELKESFGVVIPLIHGKGGEDGEVQDVLNESDVPYLFSAPEVHQKAIDKSAAKTIAKNIGLNVANTVSTDNLIFSLFAKPQTGGSSIATQICNSKNEYDELLAQHPQEKFLLEEVIKGREFTVGVIDSASKPTALPIVEIISKTGVFDYESKYDHANLAQEICPAEIDETLAKKLQTLALRIHEEIGIRHLSRTDFMMDSTGKIFFLEINTIPGMTKTSLIPKMVAAAGLDLETLLKEWVDEVLYEQAN